MEILIYNQILLLNVRCRKIFIVVGFFCISALAMYVDNGIFHDAGKPSELADIGAVIKDSQALIAGPINDKLTVAARYTDRKATLELLRYSILLVQNAAAKNNTPATIDKLARLSETYERIAANGNIKLQLAALIA